MKGVGEVYMGGSKKIKGSRYIDKRIFRVPPGGPASILGKKKFRK